MSRAKALSLSRNRADNDMQAVNIQRMLELREFFIAKEDNISAALVENMFKLTDFEGVKKQVLRMYDELPKNWVTKDRYEKYKRMISQGVTPTKVRREMAKDGIDPEELNWDDETSSKVRSVKTAEGRRTMLRQSQSRTRKGSQWRKPRGVFRTKGSRPRKGSLIDLGMDEYELQADLTRFRCARTDSREDLSKEVVTQRKGPLRKLKAQMTKKRPPKESIRDKYTSRTGVSSTGSDETNSSTDTLDMLDMTEEKLKENKFEYTTEALKLSDREVELERKKSVYSTLTKKNKVGHLHDYVPFFNKKEKMRKSSVGNIKRRLTRKSMGRKQSNYGVFYQDKGDDMDFEVKEEKEEVKEKSKVPPKAAPRKRRQRRTSVESKSSNKDV